MFSRTPAEIIKEHPLPWRFDDSYSFKILDANGNMVALVTGDEGYVFDTDVVEFLLSMVNACKGDE